MNHFFYIITKPFLRSLAVFLAFISLGAFPVSAQTSQEIAPANPWEAENLFVIVKDSDSVFMTANQNYVDSLTPFFPEIQSPEDLLGKTDYDFYPSEDAAKYQADDQVVISSGEGYETIEENQVEGGERTFVYVNKEPLFNSIGEVTGLVVTFYGIPEPGQTVIPSPRNPRQSTSVIITDKNADGTYLNSNEQFITAFQSSFPYLDSVLNLIGRNDYCFYPVEVAEKIIADDVCVALTGKPMSTIEFEYIPGGPTGVFYHVLRKPLRDASRQVIGVRTIIRPISSKSSKKNSPPKNNSNKRPSSKKNR